MSFSRIIKNRCMINLNSLKEVWWKDLLGAWQPSGLEKKSTRCLRIAVRDNYLNFYLDGQSVARVGFAYSQPYCETHSKYLFDNVDGQKYVRININGEYCHPNNKNTHLKWDQNTLHKIIQNAKNYSGKEKTFVDNLVSSNSNVIDMEMALPVPGKSSKRMDLVTIHQDKGNLHLIFWEAKMIGNKELVAEKTPKVIEQIQTYKRYLADDKNVESIRYAYINTYKVQNLIHELAKQIDSSIPDLDFNIDESLLMKKNIIVDSSVRLLICDDGTHNSNWAKHLQKLKHSNIQCFVINDSKKNYKLDLDIK